jgi:O-acetyl-ADP-ribose deacetylase (regulator of RNase III)
MEIKYFDGDVLTSTAPIIMHQVNCKGVMNSGIAKAIKEKWPVVFDEYLRFYQNLTTDVLLGTTQFVKIGSDRYVANLFAQEKYGYNGIRHTSYDAIDKCLRSVARNAENGEINRVAMPYKMSSDRGGADWDVILALVNSAFKDTDITVEIWKL